MARFMRSYGKSKLSPPTVVEGFSPLAYPIATSLAQSFRGQPKSIYFPPPIGSDFIAPSIKTKLVIGKAGIPKSLLITPKLLFEPPPPPPPEIDPEVVPPIIFGRGAA